MIDYPKLIHDYLAGELSREDEAQLFEGLSNHPEWREEMQLQLQMERAMEKDLRSIAVPSSAATAVFTGLGFRRPSKLSSMLHSSRFATWTTQRIAFMGISGILLFGAGYLIFRSNASQRNVIQKINAAQNIRRPSHNQTMPSMAADAKSELRMKAPLHVSNSEERETAIPNLIKDRVPKSSANNASTPSFGPDEPLRYYSDIGNLYSVHYFTPEKIIGVSYAGQIFLSEDSGHSWALEHTGVSSDLYGIHFCDMVHGLAVGAHGTVLITSDCGKSWNIVPSGTTTTLSTVRFITTDTAYICGDNGMMLRSTNGGLGWELLSTGVHANLFRMAFRNGMEGDVYGSNGLHLITSDGGNTWKSIQ